MKTEKFLYSYNTIIARKLRKEQTRAEKILWEKLRNRKFKNEKFKRQHSINSFITDFYCYAHRLIIEVDGSVHDDEDQKKYDFQREIRLKEDGFKIVRFSNNEVLNHMDKVLEEIGNYLS